ncbi:MAG: type II toxin-antitoxin system VapC family toxin [Mycobacteriales bacterium]
MRLLLDTQALLWWLGQLPQLGPEARRAIGRPDASVYVSAVSACEISIKHAKGKLQAPDDLAAQVAANDFIELPLTLHHGLELAQLPAHHGDPFDRMLVAQTRVEGLTLVTSDRVLDSYRVPILPAGS